MIDLDHMPPDWKFAQNHARALKPGLVDNINTQHTKNVYCTCCLKPIIKNEISLWSNSKQLQFLGFGFPLYFIFIKYCIILLLILICSYSSISLYWAIQDNRQFCSGGHRLLSGTAAVCTSFMIRFAHIESEVSVTQTVLRITSFILHIATLIYIRDHIQKTKQYYDQKTTTFSDYSLVFKNLPLVNNIQKKIKKFVDYHFEQQWKQLSMKYSGQEFKKEKVVQITLIPHTQQFYDLIAQKKLLIQQKRKIIIAQQKKQHANHKKQQSATQMNVKQFHKNAMNEQLNQQSEHSFPVNTKIVQQKIRQKTAQIDNMCLLFQEMASKDVLASQIAIVVLNTQIFKNTILQDVEQGRITKQVLQKYFGQQAGQIQITEAPQPSQIIWQNVNYPLSKRLGRKIIGWGLTLMFLAITTVGFYFLLLLKTNNLLHAIQQHDHNKYVIAVFLVFLSLLLIVFFNKLFMGWVLHHFAHLQKHDNTFEQQFSFGLKYTLGLFFTTALMTLAVEAITFHNFYSHEYGVIQQQSIMFFINAFLIPIIWLVNPWQLFNLGKRKLYKDKKSLTQAQANHIMSDTGYAMGKRYAEIIQTMWFTFLYATLIPFGAFLTIIGISLYYWVDKYNLLRRSSLKNNISGKMAIRSLKLLDLTLLLRPLGQLMFDTQMRNGYSASTIVFIVIGALYFILPMGDILQFFHEQKFNQQQKSFQEVKYMFLQTYETLHPIFGYKSSKTMINSIKKRTSKQISLSKLQSTDYIMEKKSNILKIQNRQKIDQLHLNQQSSSLDMTLRLIPHKDNDKQTLKAQDKKKQYQNIANSNNVKSQNAALSQSQRFKAKKNQVANDNMFVSIDRNLGKSPSGSKFNQGQHTYAEDQFIGQTVFKTQKKK